MLPVLSIFIQNLIQLHQSLLLRELKKNHFWIECESAISYQAQNEFSGFFFFFFTFYCIRVSFNSVQKIPVNLRIKNFTNISVAFIYIWVSLINFNFRQTDFESEVES